MVLDYRLSLTLTLCIILMNSKTGNWNHNLFASTLAINVMVKIKPSVLAAGKVKMIFLTWWRVEVPVERLVILATLLMDLKIKFVSSVTSLVLNARMMVKLAIWISVWDATKTKVSPLDIKEVNYATKMNLENVIVPAKRVIKLVRDMNSVLLVTRIAQRNTLCKNKVSAWHNVPLATKIKSLMGLWMKPTNV